LQTDHTLLSAVAAGFWSGYWSGSFIKLAGGYHLSERNDFSCGSGTKLPWLPVCLGLHSQVCRQGRGRLLRPRFKASTVPPYSSTPIMTLRVSREKGSTFGPPARRLTTPWPG